VGNLGASDSLEDQERCGKHSNRLQWYAYENWSELPVVSFPFIRTEHSGSAPKS
jgi:hypothetical protein